MITGSRTVLTLAAVAMAFLSFLQVRCKGICQRVNDRLRYCRHPNRLWFYRLVIGLHEAFFNRAKLGLIVWCRLLLVLAGEMGLDRRQWICYGTEPRLVIAQ